MNALHRSTWVLGALVSGLFHCGGTTAGSSPHGGADAGPPHGGADAGPSHGDAGAPGPGDSGACPGNPAASGVPTDHRATATACAASKAPPLPDAGATPCTTSTDCSGDAGSLFRTCRAGQCSFDACLTDSDCPSHQVCACSSDYYGGNAEYHPNVCVPGNCQVDSDCGANGYCSPSRGYCGTFDGFYCHTSGDTCVDPTNDCGTCGSACVYTPTTGHFVCGEDECTG